MPAPVKVCMILLRGYAVFRPELKERFGGAEAQFYLLARELAKDPGFEVTMVSRDFGQPDGEVIEGVRQRKIYQGGGLAGRIKPLKNLLSVWGFNRALGSVDADVYMQRSAGVETALAARLCRRRKKAFVFSVASDRHVSGGADDDSPGWMKKLVAYGIRNASLVICQNRFQQDRLRERFGIEGPVVASLCDVAGEYEPPAGEEVLWVGRCVALKRPGIFLDLAEAFPDGRFTMLLGKGRDAELYEAVRGRAEGLANVELPPPVPYQEVGKYFSRARVLVNTSEVEGFPNTFLQAMQVGAPVLSLAVDPDEALSRGGAGIVAGDDVQKLKDGLTVLLADGEEYERRSRKAHAYVKAHHDLRKITERYKGMLKELAAGESGR